MKIMIATPGDIAWAAERIGISSFRDDAKGIAMRADDGRLKCVCVFDTFSTADCNMHIGSDGTGHWLTRQFLMEVFYYPFVTCGLRRVTAIVPEKNTAALRFDRHLGFVVEGRCEDALPDDNVIILGMLKRNCRFLPKQWRAA